MNYMNFITATVQDAWNVFDLVVVAVSLASLGLSFPGVTALRLVRTIRSRPPPHICIILIYIIYIYIYNI